MSASKAFELAAAAVLVYMFFVGGKIIKYSELQPQKWKPGKRRRLLAQCNSPLRQENLPREIKDAFEKILLPLGAADKRLLPARMDMNFRRRLERQIEQLQRHRIYREIRVVDIIPLPKNNFTRWNDDGREWRECVLQCSALERFVRAADGKPIREVYRKNACLRVLQSRHIRNLDRAEKSGTYYADKLKINCPSCGAQVQLTGQQTICPYCGGVIHSDFYDWQTETFELYEQIGVFGQRMLLMLASSVPLFISIFLCLWLIPNTRISLTVGVGTAILVLAAIIAYLSHETTKREQMEKEIVRYSENYLRSCINEALYQQVSRADLMDYSVGTIRLEKVIHTEETTRISVQVYINETYLPEGKKPYTRKIKKTLTLQRARYPQRRKGTGKFFIERECPSCGANFVPDENNCCSFCGFGLQVVNSKWIVQADE